MVDLNNLLFGEVIEIAILDPYTKRFSTIGLTEEFINKINNQVLTYPHNDANPWVRVNLEQALRITWYNLVEYDGLYRMSNVKDSLSHMGEKVGEKSISSVYIELYPETVDLWLFNDSKDRDKILLEWYDSYDIKTVKAILSSCNIEVYKRSPT